MQQDGGSEGSGLAATRPPSSEELRGFLEWCLGRGTSEETCRTYVRYLQKPLDVNNKWSRLAWKAYYKYIGREDLWCSIKVKRSGVDLYVPSDEEVVAALRLLRERDLELYWVYMVLVWSGARLEEACRLLREQEDSRWIRLQGFYKYPLAWRRGSKQALYIYALDRPPRIAISSATASKRADRYGIVKPKYIRKWVATKMLALGIPEEVVNFIQGRVPQEVLSKHYLKLSTLADQYYKQYAEWLRRELLAKLQSS